MALSRYHRPDAEPEHHLTTKLSRGTHRRTASAAPANDIRRAVASGRLKRTTRVGLARLLGGIVLHKPRLAMAGVATTLIG